MNNLLNGRVGFACASGWNATDFVIAPGNYTKRRELMYEMIDTVRKLWKGEAVAFEDGNGVVKYPRIFPRPVLWFSIVVGPIACLITIYDTLTNSWIPQITNDKWWFIVGGLTLIFIFIATLTSMFASSKAYWETMNRSDG